MYLTTSPKQRIAMWDSYKWPSLHLAGLSTTVRLGLVCLHVALPAGYPPPPPPITTCWSHVQLFCSVHCCCCTSHALLLCAAHPMPSCYVLHTSCPLAMCCTPHALLLCAAHLMPSCYVLHTSCPLAMCCTPHALLLCAAHLMPSCYLLQPTGNHIHPRSLCVQESVSKG